MPQQTQKGIPNWGNEKQANTYTTSNQEFPSVYMFPDGSFVVAWQSYGQDGDVDGVYAKLYDPSGNNKTGEIRVNGYTTSYQRDPCVHGFSDGSFVVAWYGYGQDGDGYGIYFRTVSVPQAAAPYGVFVYAVFLMQSESSARASFSGGVLLAAGIVAVFAAYWWWFIRKP